MNISRLLLTAGILCMLMGTLAAQTGNQADNKYQIYLESRKFNPGTESPQTLNSKLAELRGRHVLIQLNEIPDDSRKAVLEAGGIKLLAYLPRYAWYARLTAESLDPAFGIRFLSAIEPTDKISPHIIENGIAERGLIDDNTARIYVLFFEDASSAEIDELLSKFGSGQIAFDDVWEVTLNPQQLMEFAASDIVQWIENVSPGKKAFLDIVRGRVHANQVQSSPYNLHGDGYVIAMWDAGAAYSHTDYGSRLTIGDGSGVHYHATLVAGAAVGNGSRSSICGGSSLQWRGMATQADLISYDWTSSTSEHAPAIGTYGADVSQNSWGWDLCNISSCDEFGDYDVTSRTYDRIVRGLYYDKITVVGSAGNEGECSTCSGSLPDYPYGTVAGPIATSKNALAVSGTQANTDGWWAESSRGPTDDGRLKPDIAAPACKTYDGITTTYTTNCYNSGYCGTSFSAPVVSGCAILLYEEYNNYRGTDPLPSTIRALFYHSAVDLGNDGPDYMYGYGRINVQAAADLIIADNGLGGKIIEDQVSGGQVDAYSVFAEEDQSELKVTLAWDDKEASAGAGMKLVNDLDLVLISPSHVNYYPWVLDGDSPSSPATTGIESINNVEQVVVANPEAGEWTAQVTGNTVPYSPQAYSLIGDFGANAYAYLTGDANMYNEYVEIGNPLTGPWRVGGDVTYLVNYLDITSGNQPCLLHNPNAPTDIQYFYASADATGDCLVLGGDVSRLVQFFGGNPEAFILWCGYNQPDPQNYYPPLWTSNDNTPPLEDLPAGWPNCQTPPGAARVLPSNSVNK